MFNRLVMVIKAWINALLGKVEDPSVMLEQTYQDLQTNLIQLRQAVAQTIATEKQLEQQLKKNQEQSLTWQNRAALAVEQNNDDLARQALSRKQQYTQAIAALEEQLKKQKNITTTLRQRLNDLEVEVQKAYTKKQVLIARDKAALATSKATELLSQTTAEGTLSIMDKMEQKVNEREARAAALNDLSSDQLDKQFKTLEGQPDIDAELAALKGQLRGNPPKITVKETGPGLIGSRSLQEVEAQEIKDVETKE